MTNARTHAQTSFHNLPPGGIINNKQFIDQNKSSCIAVKYIQWKLGDIYIHFRRFKVGRIDDIIFL